MLSKVLFNWAKGQQGAAGAALPHSLPVHGFLAQRIA